MSGATQSRILPQVTYNPNDSETANEAIPDRTATASVYRLKYRYSNIDFGQCFLEICIYLKHLVATTSNVAQRKKYEAAQRSLYPDIGAIGSNRFNPICSIPNLELAAYYWMAANDESTDIPSSVMERRASFVRALYESERGNNNAGNYANRNSARINFQDNGLDPDDTVCARGVTVDFAVAFVGLHPDVDVVTDLQPRIFDLLKGFVAKHCLAIGKTWQDFRPSQNLKYQDLVSEATRQEIKLNIEKILGVFGASYPGLMAGAERNYLNRCLTLIEELEFTDPKNPRPDLRDPARRMSNDEEYQNYVQKLITEAEGALATAKTTAVPTINGLFFSRGTRQTNLQIPRFNFSSVAIILRAELPKFTNPVNILSAGFDTGYRTRQIIGASIVSREMDYQSLINPQQVAENNHREKLRNRGW